MQPQSETWDRNVITNENGAGTIDALLVACPPIAQRPINALFFPAPFSAHKTPYRPYFLEKFSSG